MLRKIKELFDNSKTVDKIWVTGLLLGSLLLLYFIYKSPEIKSKKTSLEKEQIEEIEEELMM